MAGLDHVLGRSTVLLLLFQGLASADNEAVKAALLGGSCAEGGPVIYFSMHSAGGTSHQFPSLPSGPSTLHRRASDPEVLLVN